MTTDLLTPLAEARNINRLHLPRRGDLWLAFDTVLRIPLVVEDSVADIQRRQRCMYDLGEFLSHYFRHRYWNPNQAHLAIIGNLQRAILSQSTIAIKQALAAARSIGKTTILEGACIWASLYGHCRFIVFVASSGPKAEPRIASIKHELQHNEVIADDFPEMVNHIRGFAGDARRAPPEFPWSNNRVRLPNGTWIHAYGIDTGLAGLNEMGVRPDLVVMDDLETVDSVRSRSETQKIEDRLRLEILRLHDINVGGVYVWVCTVRAAGCISDRLTDVTKEPEWRGLRYRALVTPPAREDLWEQYVDLCKSSGEHITEALADPAEICSSLSMSHDDLLTLTEGHQAALGFYVHRRVEMDAGAELLDQRRLPIHALYHSIATEGEDVFACELQNDPRQNPNKTDRQLDVDFLLARRARGGLPDVLPAWASHWFLSVDIGKHRLHWEASAWSPDNLCSQLVACGIEETGANAGGRLELSDSDAARQVYLVEGIRSALTRLHRRVSEGLPDQHGEMKQPALCGVDCGGTAEKLAWMDVVLAFCASAGPRWIPLKGERWTDSISHRALGRNWICEEKNNPGRRVDANVDNYKLRLMEAYQMPEFDGAGSIYPGARLLHSRTPREYCLHQTAEKYIEQFTPDKPVEKSERMGWVVVLRNKNHWLDTAAMQFVLADVHKTLSAPAAKKKQYGKVGKAW